MLPLTHLLINLVLAYPIYKLGILGSAFQIIIFISATILIDLDHFLVYLIRLDFKSMGKLVKEAFGIKTDLKDEFHIFHTPELNLVLLILAFYSKTALIIFASNMIHIICDMLWDYYKRRSFVLQKLRCITYKMIKK